MVMKLRNYSTIELFYVVGSSRDRRGRRVLVCEGMVQNTIWPVDGVITDADMKLLGITPEDKRRIERFFGR